MITDPATTYVSTLMPQVRTVVLCMLFFLLASFPCAANDSPATSRDFGFGPLEIYEFKDGTLRLSVHDINKDGLDDVVFLNNSASRIEILIRKAPATNRVDSTNSALPSLKETFSNKGVVLDQEVIDYAIRDMDNDGLADLVTLGRRLGLMLRKQTKSGDFAAPDKIYISDPSDTVAVATGDVSEDGRPDIVLCRRSSFQVLRAEEPGDYVPDQAISVSSGTCTDIDVADLNADDIPDIVLYVSSRDYPVRIFPGNGTGSFGLENLVGIAPCRLARLVFAQTESPELGAILANGDTFRLFSIESTRAKSLLETQEAVPHALSLRGMGKKLRPSWVVTDFDGDGNEEFCIAAPELSEIHFYSFDDSGAGIRCERRSSLSGITKLSLTAAGAVVAFSPTEKSAVIHEPGASSGFPESIDLPADTVLAFASGISNELFAVSTLHDSTEATHTVSRADADNSVQWTALGNIKLDNAPEDGMAFPLDATGQTGILLFPPYRPPDMFIQGHKGITRLRTPAFKALASKLPPSAFFISSKGSNVEAVVARNNFIRAYRWQGESFEPFRQYNAGEENARLGACIAFPGATIEQGIMAFDQNSSTLCEWMSATGDVSRVHVPVNIEHFQGFAVVRNADDPVPILLLVDRNEACLFRSGSTQLAATTRSEYSSPSKKPSLMDFDSLRIGTDTKRVIGLVDTRNRSIELVSSEKDSLESQLLFEVFYDSGLSRDSLHERMEPHGIASGDLNGDGIGDMLVLVHDKLIIYPGE